MLLETDTQSVFSLANKCRSVIAHEQKRREEGGEEGSPRGQLNPSEL